MNYKMRIDPNYDPVIQFRHFPHSLLSIEEGLGINSMSTKSGKVYNKEFYISEIQGILYGRSVDITEKLHFLGVCENIYGMRRKFQGVSFSSAFRENIEVSFLDLTTNSNPLQTGVNMERSYRDMKETL